jgi:hypothetical protein
MAGRSLDYKDEIDAFVSRYKDLRQLQLDEEEWEAIALVAGWLKSFRAATVEMSRTKDPMLSTVHAIFRGLQEHIRTILSQLPATVSPKLREGLIAAHTKLSDYYYKSDESPFYTWAASMFITFFLSAHD